MQLMTRMKCITLDLWSTCREHCQRAPPGELGSHEHPLCAGEKRLQQVSELIQGYQHPQTFRSSFLCGSLGSEPLAILVVTAQSTILHINFLCLNRRCTCVGVGVRLPPVPFPPSSSSAEVGWHRSDQESGAGSGPTPWHWLSGQLIGLFLRPRISGD